MRKRKEKEGAKKVDTALRNDAGDYGRNDQRGHSRELVDMQKIRKDARSIPGKFISEETLGL